MSWLIWFQRTATVIGVPVTIWLIAMGTKLGITHASCGLTGFYCSKIQQSQPSGELEGDPIANAIGTLKEAYPDYDVIIKEGKK
jgi:hypothetical protein